MPAQTRLKDEAGLYYHVYNKGIDARLIFNDEDDYSVFLNYLEDYLNPPKSPESAKRSFKIKGRTFQGVPHLPKNYLNDLELVAYSLKPDHFHLVLLQKNAGSLEKFIRSLFTRYSMYFNKKNKRTGSLFSGPYKSIKIKGNQNFLPYLTRFLHHTGSRTSYSEYLGKRSTSWVRPEAILSLFKMNKDGYKYFMDERKYDQKEKELIDSISFASDIECLEERNLEGSSYNGSSQGKKSPVKVLTFWGMSLVMFLLLVNLSVKNIQVSAVKQIQSLPIPIQSQEAEVLGTEEEEGLMSEPAPEATTQDSDSESIDRPKITLTVKLEDSSYYVNIRQEPSTDSAKLGKAFDGQTFEFVSQKEDWYEVELPDGSKGFISAEFLTEEEASN